MQDTETSIKRAMHDAAQMLGAMPGGRTMGEMGVAVMWVVIGASYEIGEFDDEKAREAWTEMRDCIDKLMRSNFVGALRRARH